MLMPRLRFLLLSLLIAVQVQAQDEGVGLAFLVQSNDAAAMAMGGAQVALTQDAFATYWNPAGLMAATSNQVALAHRRWVFDERHYALAGRFQAGENGSFGLFATAEGINNIELREQPGAPEAEGEAFYGAFGASYARRLGSLRVGVSAKYLIERLLEVTANGYAFDAGVQLDLLNGDVRLGAALHNFGEMENLIARNTNLPRRIQVGAAAFPFRILAADGTEPVLKATVTADVSHLLDVSEEATQVHLGLAAEALDLVTLRVGYTSNLTLYSFSYGLGLALGDIVVDYALLPFTDGFGGPGHVFTMRYGW